MLLIPFLLLFLCKHWIHCFQLWLTVRHIRLRVWKQCLPVKHLPFVRKSCNWIVTQGLTKALHRYHWGTQVQRRKADKTSCMNDGVYTGADWWSWHIGLQTVLHRQAEHKYSAWLGERSILCVDETVTWHLVQLINTKLFWPLGGILMRISLKNVKIYINYSILIFTGCILSQICQDWCQLIFDLYKRSLLSALVGQYISGHMDTLTLLLSPNAHGVGYFTHCTSDETKWGCG